MKEIESEALALRPTRELVLSPVMDLEVAKHRLHQFQEFVAHYLEASNDGGQDGGDYGAIPGAGTKKVLFKSGADKLCELYGMYDEYKIDAQENFESKLFYYKVTCILKSRRDDSTLGTGLGSCNSYESKYRWRDSSRKCPKCGADTIIFGKEEYFKADGTGYYLCFKKKGGCGTGYKKGDQAIESQTIGRVENPDIMDTVNTVLKMAKKRAKVDAVIAVTRSSGIFTSDLEDIAMPSTGSAEAQKVVLERKLAEIKAEEEQPVKKPAKRSVKPVVDEHQPPAPMPGWVAAAEYPPDPALVAKKWFIRIEQSPTVDMLKEVGLLLAKTDDALSQDDRTVCRELYMARMNQLTSPKAQDGPDYSQDDAPAPTEVKL